MKSLNIAHSFILVLIMLMIISSSEAQDYPGPNMYISIQNDIPHETVRLNCTAFTFDIEIHELSYKEILNKSFPVITPFECAIYSKHGFGHYTILSEKVTYHCDYNYPNCQWVIKKDGPCLRDVSTQKFMCQKWEKPAGRWLSRGPSLRID